jgi:hypothetical protein
MTGMVTVSATQAKQSFGAALAQSEIEPVAIERHGKVVAMLIAADQLPDLDTEKKLARLRQAGIEAERLIRHQALAIRLLKASPEAAERLVQQAKAVVDLWEERQLCSEHFISRWRALLALPLPELVERMCGDAEGWGRALRQNSPWSSLP